MIYLYRINGGEVLGISTDADPWPGVDTNYFAKVTDPPAPDGSEFDPRKIWDGAQIRNASQAEIDSFPTFKAQDENTSNRSKADIEFDSSRPTGKLIKAVALVTMDEINILRSQHGLSARSAAQIKTAIKNKLSSGDAD